MIPYITHTFYDHSPEVCNLPEVTSWRLISKLVVLIFKNRLCQVMYIICFCWTNCSIQETPNDKKEDKVMQFNVLTWPQKSSRVPLWVAPWELPADWSKGVLYQSLNQRGSKKNCLKCKSLWQNFFRLFFSITGLKVLLWLYSKLINDMTYQ